MIRWTTTHRMLLLILCLIGAVGGSGCGPAVKVSSTRIDPATVSLSDRFNERLPGDSKTTRVTVTPAAAAVSIPLGGAGAALAGLTTSGTASTASAGLVGAGMPVSVKLEGREISAPPGSALTVEITDVKSPAETTHEQNAQAAGATIRTDGDPTKLGASSTAPEVGLAGGVNRGVGGGGTSGGGGTASGGGFTFDFSAMVGAVATRTGANWIMAIGILFLVAAAVYVVAELFFKSPPDWALAGIMAGTGLLFIGAAIVVEQHPWILVLLFVLMIVAAIGYVLWWKFGKQNHVLQPASIPPSPPMAPKPVAPAVPTPIGMPIEGGS